MDLERAAAAYAEFLRALDVDLFSRDMVETPRRVAQATAAMISCLDRNPLEVIRPVALDYRGLISFGPVAFTSLCEHHMVPFYGTATVVLEPSDGLALGLSRFEELVRLLALRPQLQERLTAQIARALEKGLAPAGVLVQVKAFHTCALLQSGANRNARCVTVCGHGTLGDGGAKRSEGYALLGGCEDVSCS